MTAPTLTRASSTPLNSDINVSTETNIVLVFDQAVDVESGNVVLYKDSDDSVVETIAVTSGQVTGTGTTTITINPSVVLEGNTKYYLLKVMLKRYYKIIFNLKNEFTLKFN